jgi:hypothetical protein
MLLNRVTADFWLAGAPPEQNDKWAKCKRAAGEVSAITDSLHQ